MTDFADRTLIESLKDQLHDKEREVQRIKQWSRRWKTSAKHQKIMREAISAVARKSMEEPK